jgi:two-component system NtrC family sensor kinase
MEIKVIILVQSAVIILLLFNCRLHRRIRQSLRRSENRFHAVIKGISDALVAVDEQGLIVAFNPTAEKLFGYARSEMIGRPLDRLLPERFRNRHRQAMARYFAEGASDHVFGRPIEVPALRFDGAEISIELSLSRLEAVGEALAVLATIRDISRRKTDEAALRESGEKFKHLFQEYQALLDNIPDAITLFAPGLTVVRSNLGAARLLDRPVTGLPGQHCSALWRGCSAAGGECPVEQCFGSGKTEKATIKTADDRSWRVRAFPVLDKQGHTVRVIAHSRDVSHQLQMEQEARRANHLASLGELAAGVAHEINNPINGIINYAQVLADDAQVSEENREILHSITEEGGRIANIVSSLLTFARARQETKGPVSLGDVLTATLPLAEAQLRKDHIELRVDVDSCLPEVMAHTQQIQQVILNLISNARYALNERYPEPHESKILHIYSEPGTEAGRSRVCLVFRDSGTGIPADRLSKVMDPFYTTKPSGRGTGLGLSISHGILKDHGGALKIDSIEGSHTAVAIELPVPEEDVV